MNCVQGTHSSPHVKWNVLADCSYIAKCKVLWHSVQRFENWWVLTDRQVLTLPWVTGYTRLSLYRTSTLFGMTSVFSVVTPCSLEKA
jgi:hypothetical protein